jgi:malonyl CoA-acyl carrier protein transacylase
MKFALVFPGQGSQSLGMMAAYGDSSVVRVPPSTRLRALAAISGNW